MCAPMHARTYACAHLCRYVFTKPFREATAASALREDAGFLNEVERPTLTLTLALAFTLASSPETSFSS